MKALLSSILILFVLAPDFAGFNNDFRSYEAAYEKASLEGKHTREKKLKKEFQVSSNSNLTIDNSYGNVDVTTWKENKVVIEVIIKTNGNDEEEVEEKLEEINVEFKQTASGVEAKTRFSKDEKSWWKKLFDGFDNVNMEVNYIIRAPESNNLLLSNDYGGVYVDKTTGNTRINCDYGKIDVGELRGRSNSLNFDYTRNSRIGYVTNAEINSDYSSFEIEEAGSIQLNADYSDSRIEKVSDLNFSCDYGSLSINKVQVMKGDGDYLTTKINRVFNTLDLNLDYGSLAIEKIIKGAQNISIDTDYTGVKIGYDNEMAFQFEVKTSYGSVKGLEDLQVEKRSQTSNSNSVSGYYGTSNNGARIIINTSYGNIDFRKQ